MEGRCCLLREVSISVDPTLESVWLGLELLLRDGGIPLLLGARGYGSEGSLRRFIPDPQIQKSLLMDAARQCQESGFYDKVM